MGCCGLLSDSQTKDKSKKYEPTMENERGEPKQDKDESEKRKKKFAIKNKLGKDSIETSSTNSRVAVPLKISKENPENKG